MAADVAPGAPATEMSKEWNYTEEDGMHDVVASFALSPSFGTRENAEGAAIAA